MNSIAKTILAVAVLGGFLVGGYVLAQPAPPSTQDTTEMRANVTRLVGDARKDTNVVVALQLKARKDKDVVRLTCINEKLLQIKALRNVLDDNQRVVEASENQGSYDALVSTTANIRQLREQAQICAGEAQFVTDMQNGFTGPDIPDDPTKDLFPGGPEQPGYASPYN